MELRMRKLSWLLCGMLLAMCATAGAALPDIGVNCPNLHGYRFFSPDHAWSKDISGDPIDPSSSTILGPSPGYGGSSTLLHCDFGPGSGIPYNVVSGSQRKIRLVISGGNGEGDGMMFPIPPDAVIEGGGDGGSGDSHCLVLDRDNGIIYETFVTRRMNGGKYFQADFGCVFNMRSSVLRPLPWSSADAAGLSILAGLVRGDEVFVDKVITHPIRFVVSTSKMNFVLPATHRASSQTGPYLLPMGARLRIRGDIDVSYFPEQARIIATALKKYGMILADNGGNFYLNGTPDNRWVFNQLQTINGISLSWLELVKRGVEYRY
jgi:hypothetical protein